MCEAHPRKARGFPHSDISGSKVARHLPEAYRSHATSFIAISSQGIHHTPLNFLLGNSKTAFPATWNNNSCGNLTFTYPSATNKDPSADEAESDVAMGFCCQKTSDFYIGGEASSNQECAFSTSAPFRFS